jgi:hypothetical protein
MKNYTALIVLITLAAFCCIPAMAVVTYVGGSPQMTAYVTGVNEFSPGQDATITVVIQNSGTNQMKFLGDGTIPSEDIPTTAKQVKAGLSAGDAPIVIKTDTQSLGDIASPGRVTATFNAKITTAAQLGQYQLPLTLHYRYRTNDHNPQPSSDSLMLEYTDVTTVVPLTLRIKPEVKIDVIDAVPENLVVGSEGYINLTIRNIGYEDGTQASVKIHQSGNSAILPTDSNVYVGDFPRNGVVSCIYKVSVTSDAQAQTYPVDVEVTYTDSEGNIIASDIDTIGVPVRAKLAFSVVSSTAAVIQGQTGIVEVQYRNDGSVTAYQAQVRITAVDPFTSSDNTAYLGDVAPGETATATYSLTAESAATVGKYNLDTDIRYRDSLDNSLDTDTFETPFEVVQAKSGGLLEIPAALTLIAIILIGAGYYLLVMRKKR